METLSEDKYLVLLSKAVECSINAIGMTDLEGNLIYVNDSAVKLWGYSDKKEMIGKFLSDFWEGRRIFDTIEKLHCQGHSKGEDIGKRKDGSLFEIEYYVLIPVIPDTDSGASRTAVPVEAGH